MDQVDQMVRSFLSSGPADQLAILNMVSPSVNADLGIIPDRAWRNTVTTARLQRAVDRHALARAMAEEYDGPRVLELIDKLEALTLRRIARKIARGSVDRTTYSSRYPSIPDSL